MKLKIWILSALVPLTVLSVLAQTPAPPAAPPPAPAVSLEPLVPEPGAPPAKPATKPKHAKAKHPKASTTAKAAPSTNSFMPFDPPVAATVKCDVLDVRGQGSFVGEVITHLKKGDNVTVLGEITHSHAHANEPSKWSRIAMPAGTKVWVSAEYIDADSGTVRVKKVNVRGGPGENYSVVARLEKGTPVKIEHKEGGWVVIESPTNAYAYVASEYLDKSAEPPAGALAATPVPTPPSGIHVALPPTGVTVPPEGPAPAPANPAAAGPNGPAAPAPTPASQTDQELAALRRATSPEPAAATVPPPPAPETLPEVFPRIVTREGYVHKALNIQAPADYELRDIKTAEMIEFVQPAPGQKFKIFVGTRVRITGAEILDPRWPRIPILQVQKVDLMP